MWCFLPNWFLPFSNTPPTSIFLLLPIQPLLFPYPTWDNTAGNNVSWIWLITCLMVQHRHKETDEAKILSKYVTASFSFSGETPSFSFSGETSSFPICPAGPLWCGVFPVTEWASSQSSGLLWTPSSHSLMTCTLSKLLILNWPWMQGR